MNIEYKEFERHMKSIIGIIRLQKSISNSMVDYNSLNKEDCEIFFPTLVDNVIDLLEYVTNDRENQSIYWWVHEKNCGMREDLKAYDKNGGEIKTSTIEDLWNMLKSYESDCEPKSIKEIKADLFSAGDDYYLAHCISGDYALGAGIAVEFDNRFNMRDKLNTYYDSITYHDYIGKALLIDNIFNLVTKSRYWMKPTYETIRSSVEDMKNICISKGIKKIAMPKIGCGLDGLEYKKVKNIIEDVFCGTGIEVVIFYL